MFDLSGRRVLITGATGGIGEKLAESFYEKGCELVLHGTNKAKIEALAQRLVSVIGQKAKIHVIEANLADLAQVKQLSSSALELMGGVDILLNNAGITRDGLLMRMSDEDFTSVININLTAACLLARDISVMMLKQRYGRIINISSVVGFLGNAGQTNYCAAKAGMIGFTKSLARELAAKSVTVNAIAPGFIESAMTEKLNDKQRESIMYSIPMRRMGKAQEIAAAAIYLASAEAAYITGQTLHINGGMAMI